jgi:uncharacterized tellurite resistance protein B-like protein
MNDRLRQLYDHVATNATAEREHEAAIELLLLTMVADRHISMDELDAIRQISEDSGFESDTFSFDQYLGTAVAEGTVGDLLDDIDGRIASSVLRSSLFAAVRDVAGVDAEVSPQEESILAQVAVRFG